MKLWLWWKPNVATTCLSPDIPDDWVIVVNTKKLVSRGKAELAIQNKYIERRSLATKAIARCWRRHRWVHSIEAIELMRVAKIRLETLRNIAETKKALDNIATEKKLGEQAPIGSSTKPPKERKPPVVVNEEKKPASKREPTDLQKLIYKERPLVLNSNFKKNVTSGELTKFLVGFKRVSVRTHPDRRVLKWTSFGYSPTASFRKDIPGLNAETYKLFTEHQLEVLHLAPLLYHFTGLDMQNCPKWFKISAEIPPALYCFKPVLIDNEWEIQLEPFIENSYGLPLLSTIAYHKRKEYLAKTKEVEGWQSLIAPVIPVDFDLLPKLEEKNGSSETASIVQTSDSNSMQLSDVKVTFKNKIKDRKAPPAPKETTCGDCGEIYPSKAKFRDHLVYVDKELICGAKNI